MRPPHARPEPDHYSYTAYADPAMAQTFDDRRFSGPVGELVASSQARVLARFIGHLEDRTILDVGTGTGRAALFLTRSGAQVTAVDASEPMLEVARQRAAEQGLNLRFLVGDAHALEFRDRSFDVAVSLRVLMHAPEWRRCIAELCRVADRLVVVDYPSARSAALLHALGRRVVNAAGGRTEAYRVFTDQAIVRALDESGFRVRSIHRQFALPLQLHRAIGSRRFTECSEDLLDRVGLRRLFGSPVTLVAERCASS